jgi:UDP:flavonoid glycosyltransferase YjiC (YdhE family)
MRVLIASTHGAGHFGPLVPFADAYLRNGDEVLVVGPPTLDARDYPFRVGASPPENELATLWSTLHEQPSGQSEVIVVGTIFAELNVNAMLPTFEAVIEEWKPDLILRETNEYASAIAAERHGIAHVRVSIGLALAEDAALSIASPQLEDVAPGITAAIAASPYLTLFPESLDPAPFRARRFRDPALDGPTEPLPDWWPGDERPLVYLTFGTVAAALPRMDAVYRKALEAVADLPVRVLLTVGGEADLGAVPANVHVETYVPQANVLASATAVVCHGGSGTTIGALAFGKPLVVVPLFADQPHNAWRVARVGAGVIASPATLRRQIERVLGDDGYARAAERVAAEMRALPPVDDFVG